MWARRWVWREMRPDDKDLDCQDRSPGFGLWAKRSLLQIRGWEAAPRPSPPLPRNWPAPGICSSVLPEVFLKLASGPQRSRPCS